MRMHPVLARTKAGLHQHGMRVLQAGGRAANGPPGRRGLALVMRPADFSLFGVGLFSDWLSHYEQVLESAEVKVESKGPVVPYARV